jgi:uncharacterized damage-inducible protein DinB/predicted RNase H-like HicB family nuclease
MPRYEVYLEVHSDGRTMAHVPALPGCIARGPSRQETLRLLGEAVKGHQTWLRNHGEQAPGEGILSELVLADEYPAGPFDPGSTTALLPPDLAPVEGETVARYLRLMDHARADLLTLTSQLPPEVLDWQESADMWSIARILRHVANAERWYVSRIVPLEELGELERADELPLFEYLALARRVSSHRLATLTEEQRSRVVTPTAFAREPEPWTARKALRRYVEHELEHTRHVCEVLAAWRTQLVARIQYARAEILDQLTGLTTDDLTGPNVFDSSTAVNVLAHIASWDEFFAQRLKMVREDQLANITGVEVDERNALTARERRGWGLERSLSAFLAARSALLAELGAVSIKELHHPLSLPWGQPTIYRWIEICIEHDEEHAGHLREWRRTLGEAARAGWRRQGPKLVLMASLHAWREALLAWMACVPPRQQETLPVVAGWTLKDVAGHIADWDGLTTEMLQAIREDREPLSDYDGNVEAWNAGRVAARAGESWDVAWSSLRKARRDVLSALDQFDDEALLRPYKGSLGGNAYGWAYAALEHDRDHTQDVRLSITHKG